MAVPFSCNHPLGLLLRYFPSTNLKNVHLIRLSLLVAFSTSLLFGTAALGADSIGAIAVLVAAFIAGHSWKEDVSRYRIPRGKGDFLGRSAGGGAPFQRVAPLLPAGSLRSHRLRALLQFGKPYPPPDPRSVVLLLRRMGSPGPLRGSHYPYHHRLSRRSRLFSFLQREAFRLPGLATQSHRTSRSLPRRVQSLPHRPPSPPWPWTSACRGTTCPGNTISGVC